MKTPFGKAAVVSVEYFLDTLNPAFPQRIDFGDFIDTIKPLKGPTRQIIAKQGRLLAILISSQFQPTAQKCIQVLANMLRKALGGSVREEKYIAFDTPTILLVYGK